MSDSEQQPSSPKPTFVPEVSERENDSDAPPSKEGEVKGSDTNGKTEGQSNSKPASRASSRGTDDGGGAAGTGPSGSAGGKLSRKGSTTGSGRVSRTASGVSVGSEGAAGAGGGGPTLKKKPSLRRKSFSRLPHLCTAEDKETIIFDPEMSKQGKWINCTEHYGVQPGETLVPADISKQDIEQGSSPDCFFITVASLIAEFPTLVESLFLTREQPSATDESPTYKFRFWRWNRWVPVQIDAMVPADKESAGGKPTFARSPTKRVWPLLLEKAYAAFYGGFQCIEGGNLAETFHDLTGKPVVNVSFDPTIISNLNLKTSPLRDASFWKDLKQKLDKKMCIVSTGSNHDVDPKLGLQNSHAYGLLGLHYIKEGGPSKQAAMQMDRFVVHLLNPYRMNKYTGPLSESAHWRKYDSGAITVAGIVPPAKKSGKGQSQREEDEDGEDHTNTFYMPLPEFIKNFAGLQICRLDINSDDTLVTEGVEEEGEGGEVTAAGYSLFHFPFEFDQDTAGGNFNHASWRKNPSFVVRNSTGQDVVIVATLKQPERRTVASKSADALSYLQCGLTLVEVGTKKKDSKGAEQFLPLDCTTALRTASNSKVHQKPFYYNQRETSAFLTIPKEMKRGYLVPSTYRPHQHSGMLLSTFIPSPFAHSGALKVTPFNGAEEYGGKYLKHQFDTSQGKTHFFKFHAKRTAVPNSPTDESSSSPTDETTATASAVPKYEVHMLLSQLKEWNKDGKPGNADEKQQQAAAATDSGDIVTSHFMSVEVQRVPQQERIAGMSSATNYREVALIFDLPLESEEESDFLVAVTCAKGSGSVPCRVSIGLRPAGAVDNCTLTLAKAASQQPQIIMQSQPQQDKQPPEATPAKKAVAPPATAGSAKGKTVPPTKPGAPKAAAGKGKAPAPAPAPPAKTGAKKGPSSPRPTPAAKPSAPTGSTAPGKSAPISPRQTPVAKKSAPTAPSSTGAKKQPAPKAAAPPAVKPKPSPVGKKSAPAATAAKKAPAPQPKSLAKSKAVVSSVGDMYANLE